MTESRTLPLLACAGFASMASMRMCDAMLPALAQAFGTRAADAAGTISAFALAYGLMQLIYGSLGDRFGKARIISLAAWGCAGTSVAASFAPSLELLTVGRGLMGGFAAGIIPLTMAWIGDRVPYEQRQEALARLLTWTLLGMMLGAWAGGALAQLANWRSAFVAVAVLFAAAAFGVSRAGRDERPHASATGIAAYAANVAELLRSPWTRRVLAVVFVEAGLVGGAMAFVPTALHDRLQLTLLEAGGVLALFGLGGLVYSRLAGRAVRRLGAPALAVAGAGCLALAFALLAAMPSLVVSAAACLLAGFGFYLLHNTLQTCATQLSATARGTGVSLFASALFLGQAIGVTLAAAVVARHSPAAWFIGAAPLLLALGVYFATRLRMRLAAGRALA